MSSYIITESGWVYRIYQEAGEWFYEPEHRSDKAYSEGYPTAEAAERAARKWEREYLAHWREEADESERGN